MPYVKEFFVKSDPTFSALLKLEILTHLIDEDNASMILKELQTYVRLPDPQLVQATIQAIGRCALNIPSLMDSCLKGLMALARSRKSGEVPSW